MKTLHRPMFRRGGSTGEGITSGLSRQGYETGKTVQPRRPNTNLNNFLIDFGLDLISRPPQGGIFATAASAAKDPFSRFQARQVAQEDRDWQQKMYDEKMAFEQEKFKEDKSQFKRELEQQRYLGELEAQGEKQFIEDQINAYWDPLIEAELDEEKKKLLENEKRADKYNIIVQGADISDQYKILTNEAAYSLAVANAEAEIVTLINPQTKVAWVQDEAGYNEKLQELINKYLRLATKFLDPDKKAEGGRAGFLGGGSTEDVNIMTETPGGIADINIAERDSGTTNEVNISYGQLRDRLPPEISNEIVLLLSQSYEAFADFAEIQTQADVNEFNTKYNVQLFLPQQTGA